MNILRNTPVYFRSVLVQVLGIVFISAALGLGANMIHPSGIPLVGDWSAAQRFSDTTGNDMTISLDRARSAWRDKACLFLDARDVAAFSRGHIKGAKSLPWHEVDDYFFPIVRGLAKDTLIITYCDGENCQLSHELALFLKDMGFLNTRVLVNGWSLWQASDLPVEQG